MRVIVMRPMEAAARTQKRLARLGHQVIAGPLMVYAQTGERAPAGAFEAMLATSAQAFAGFMQTEILESEILQNLPLYVVGKRTAQAAREAGLPAPEYVAPDAGALSDIVRARLRPRARLLYLAGLDRKPELEASLATAGFEIAPWVVYDAQPVPVLTQEIDAALRAGRVEAALHYSKRSAEIFCEAVAQAGLGEAAKRLRHVAISQDCAEGLAALNAVDVRIAASPNESAMAALLA